MKTRRRLLSKKSAIFHCLLACVWQHPDPTLSPTKYYRLPVGYPRRIYADSAAVYRSSRRLIQGSTSTQTRSRIKHRIRITVRRSAQHLLMTAYIALSSTPDLITICHWSDWV